MRALYDDCRRWVSSPRPRGPERFLDSDGRIDRYPAQAAGRLAVLRHVAGRAFSPDTVLRERDVNEQLGRVDQEGAGWPAAASCAGEWACEDPGAAYRG
ncbi:DUF2087 domain-containing protein, partial [Microbacterium sp. SCN 69-37]|uniref:DUF2087 domain-containing protein n=1 Tax=Microbacterium sp. SCN 69-37 TaxID=1660115 RepID=UPI0025FEDDB0